MEIPTKINAELKKVQLNHPMAHIAYNATKREYFISYLSAMYYSSLMIIRP